MIIIYALSGIALNHKNDWNPNYIIELKETSIELPSNIDFKSKEALTILLQKTEQSKNYKKHYYPNNNQIKVFLHEGAILTYNKNSQKALLESLKKRPLFYSINYLHYNPGNLWKWFSDIFSVCLILLTITGAIILKGKNGIKQRGWVLIFIGIIIPLIFFFIY